ncbi:uncharacterized protein C1orf141 homolog isoform X2 [Sminthopsis crassicaudata]|uniref:uncharacterized protein C1orf141 homolog isoform X2 n=1 Tax=Sminthopsis crassicaudata TaxID=9301 RepID=UPI003D69CA6D
MTERILEKLIALDEYSEKMMEMRELKCRMQNISVKKSLTLPLTFEFYTGFEKPCPKIIASKLKESFQKEQSLVDGQKMDSKVASGPNVWKPKVITSGLLPRKCLFGKANIRPYSVPGNLKYHPLENLQPSEIPEKWKMVKPFLNPKYKDKTETGHIISWVGIPEPATLPSKEPDLGTAEFSTPYERKCHKLPGKNKFPYQKFVTISDPTDILTKEAIKVRKKTTTPKDATFLGKNRWFRDVFSPAHDIENETTHLIPLSFEDELNKPNAKIISLDQSKQDASPPMLSSTKPIVFHDMGYIQMFFLTRNRHYLKTKEKPISAKTNLVLKKNNEIIKSLISDPLSSVFNVKGTLLDEWQIDAATKPGMAEKEDSHKTGDFSSDQKPGEGRRVSPESEQRPQDSAPDPSQFLYSSNARHSKYLQNFRTVRKGGRMTHLDNLLSRKPPKTSPAIKTINEARNLGNKPQTPSTFKQNEKLPGSAFESKPPEPETAEQAVKGHVDFQGGKPLFLTSVEDSKNWKGEKAAPGPSSQSFNISTEQ